MSPTENAAAPIETPPTAAKPSSLGRKIGMAVSILAVLVVVMIWFGRKTMMGEKFAFSDKESVNYSGSATEAEAKRLGDVLKTVGYFTGAKELDVLLKKDGKEGTVVSFVLSGRWNDDEIVSAFRQIGSAIAAQGLGKPVTVRLIDDHLNTKNEFKCE